MKWLILAFLLCAVTGLAACALNQNLEADDWAWKSRINNDYPRTDGESLAVEVTQGGGKSLAVGNLRAYGEGEERGYVVVAVEETPADPEEPIVKIRYRVLDRRIWFESYPQYIMQIDKHREANAREVADQKMKGSLPVLPDIYDDKYFYEPSYDGGCKVEVTEKDLERNLIATYTFDVCK